MYKEKFQSVLNENEEVVRIERAKILTYILQKIVSIIITICVILFIYYCIMFSLRGENISYNSKFINYVGIGIGAIIILNFITAIKNCLNYYVCLTNKRIIVRYGTFTNNYNQYSIDNVTGNIRTNCTQSIWDKKEGKGASGKIYANIELLPVGHGEIDILIPYSIRNGYEMAKDIETVVKSNAKIAENTIKIV